MADKIAIRRLFRKSWRYMDAYGKDRLNAKQAAFAVKKFKSHRMIGTKAGAYTPQRSSFGV